VLKDYLTMSDAGKGRELARYDPYAFRAWAAEEFNAPGWLATRVERLIESGDFLDSLVDRLPDRLMESWLGSNAAGHLSAAAESPSFLHMDFRKRLPRQWLVHFSDSAGRIACDGFTKGVAWHDELGLTTHFRESYKEQGGYNFAYESGHQAVRYGRDWQRSTWKYGSGIVIFTAPAILVHHYGDEEYQAIFWGADARQIVEVTAGYFSPGLERDEEGFCVGEDSRGRSLYCATDLDDVISWVDTHYQQYERHLSCVGQQPRARAERDSGKHAHKHGSR